MKMMSLCSPPEKIDRSVCSPRAASIILAGCSRSFLDPGALRHDGCFYTSTNGLFQRTGSSE
jgi:hypothetical protein